MEQASGRDLGRADVLTREVIERSATSVYLRQLVSLIDAGADPRRSIGVILIGLDDALRETTKRAIEPEMRTVRPLIIHPAFSDD